MGDYTSISGLHRIFTKIYYILGCKTQLTQTKRTQCLLSGSSDIRPGKDGSQTTSLELGPLV